VLCLNNPLGGVRQNMEHQVRSAGVDRTRPLSTAERRTPHNQGIRPRAPEDLLVTLDLDPPTATIPKSTTLKLHKVQNSLARFVLQQWKSCHAQPLLKSLHWLPISQRINFKLATLAFKIQSTSQPEYLH